MIETGFSKPKWDRWSLSIIFSLTFNSLSLSPWHIPIHPTQGQGRAWYLYSSQRGKINKILNESIYIEVEHYLASRTWERGLFYLFFLFFLSLLFIPFLFIFLVVMGTLFLEDDLLVSMCLSITFSHDGGWIISHERQTT